MAKVQLDELLVDIDKQPEWRGEAMRAANYYDGRQLEPHVIQAMEDRGQPVLIHNLTAPAVDGVLGMEAKTRADMMVRADDDGSLEVAEALNEKLNEATRMTKTDRAVADAFAAQVKTGLGWVEVSRHSDPFKYPYRVSYVHREEIWWDWHAKEPDLSDARWLMRRRWVDRDEAEAYFPKHKETIKHAVNGWMNFVDVLDNGTESPLLSAYQEHTAFNYRTDEFLDSRRDRIRVYEVYYRVFEQGLCMRLPDERVLRFDKSNRMHVALANSGQVQLINAPYKKMRVSWYVGPHKVYDGPSAQPHDHFPYVPFWGFREDSTLVPYGIIRRMFSPQDEVNYRRSKLTYLLNNKKIIKDEDAVAMTDQQLVEEANRPDGVITLNPDRKNTDTKGFWIHEEQSMAAQQFTIMQDAERNIQECSGIYSALLGQQTGATSGIAINSLVEQGSTTLAELFDNYRFARQLVGELLLANLVQDMAGKEQEVLVNVNKPEPTKRILINQPAFNTSGQKIGISNDITRAKARVVLDDIMNTPGYRAQIAERLMNMVQTLPENIQASVVDLVIMATDVPNKEEFLKRIRRATGQGVNPEDMTEEEAAQFQQQQKAQSIQQQIALQTMQAELDNLIADAKKKHAAAVKDEAAASSMAVKDELTEAQTLKTLAELKKATKELSVAVAANQLGVPRLPNQI